MSITRYHVRCGCGQTHFLKTLAAESECQNCRWPIVYASGFAKGAAKAFTLSKHIDLTITVEPTSVGG